MKKKVKEVEIIEKIHLENGFGWSEIWAKIGKKWKKIKPV